MKKNIKIIFLIVLALLWMIGIFKLSNMNTLKSNGKSTQIINMFIEDALDITNGYGITNSYPNDKKIAHASELINAPMRKVMHASVYFGLAFIISLTLDIIFNHKKYIFIFLITLGICILFSISDEIHQTFVEGRTGRFLDVCIDTLGSIVGFLFYTTYHIVYILGYNKANKDYDKYSVKLLK